MDILLNLQTSSGDRLAVEAAPSLRPRAVPPRVAPRPVGPLYGYAQEGAALQAAIGRGTAATIGICGPDGVGKTEFLVRGLLLGREDWPDGYVLLPVRDLVAEDVIALLSDLVFEIEDPRRRPPAAVCGAALAERRILVALDDLRSPEELAAVRATLRNSLVVFTCAEQWFARDVAWISLRGLKAPEGAAFLRAVAGRDVPERLATAIATNLEGNPSRILRAVGSGLELEAVATGCVSPAAFDDFQFSYAKDELTEGDAVTFAAVATFGEAALGGQSPPASLVKRCLVERNPVGWSVPSGLRTRIEGLAIGPEALAARVLEAPSLEVLREAPVALACAAGLPPVVSEGGAAGQELATKVAHALDRLALWGASTTLYRALYGARESFHDRKMQAWVTHQLATREACSGRAGVARDLFEEALALEESDAEAAEVTQANLALLAQWAAVETPVRLSAGQRAPEVALDASDSASPAPEAVAAPGLVPSLSGAIVPPAIVLHARKEGPSVRHRPRRNSVVGAAIALTGAVALACASLLHPHADAQQEGPVITQQAERPSSEPIRSAKVASKAAKAHGSPRDGSTAASLRSAHAREAHVGSQQQEVAVAQGAARPLASVTRTSRASQPQLQGSPAAIAASNDRSTRSVPATPRPASSAVARVQPLVYPAPSAALSGRGVAQGTAVADALPRAPAGRRATVGAQHADAGSPPRITPFTILPMTIDRGGIATLCVSATHADRLYVSSIGYLDPQQTICRDVRPTKTTTYVARAVGKGGRSAVRTSTVIVRAPEDLGDHS
ncbi:MAG: hypothetical protein WAN59_10835 [Candidatus Baltobacteraceae bacterium]